MGLVLVGEQRRLIFIIKSNNHSKYFYWLQPEVKAFILTSSIVNGTFYHEIIRCQNGFHLRLNYMPPLNKINTTKQMDPRPYHFEYRRPRLSNPTYQSSHLYQSIYDLKHLTNPYRNPENSPSCLPSEAKLTRVGSTDLSSKSSLDNAEPTMHRYESKAQGVERKEKEGEGSRSRVASFGMNLVRNTSMDQREVYRRQEKKFDIISYFPKGYEPALKQFPRLTLEDKLIEHQQDHSFQLH